jgi:hypothetical protein
VIALSLPEGPKSKHMTCYLEAKETPEIRYATSAAQIVRANITAVP